MPKIKPVTVADLVEQHGEMLKMDGYDDCVAGVCLRAGQPAILIYDQAKIIAKLKADGMSESEAHEFFEFNQLGAWMGEQTPCFLTL